jgi:outer membrane receptor for ferric coprogen and ferric-rhodotorulic acid
MNEMLTVFRLKQIPAVLIVTLCYQGAAIAAPYEATEQEIERISVVGKHQRDIGATGMSLPVAQIPQSISLVDEEFIKLHNLRSIGDVIQQVAAIHTDSSQTGSDRFSYSRGFVMNRYLIDGMMAAGSAYETSVLDPVMFSRVEVIRGSTGMLQEVGQPSGTINLIQKRATAENAAEIGAELGSWHRRRLQADIGGGLNDDATIRGRFVGATAAADSFQDHSNTKRQVLFGTVSADLTEQTELTVQLSRQSDDLDQYSAGLPFMYADKTPFIGKRSHNDMPSYVYEDYTQRQAMAEVRHDFNDDWQLQGRIHQSRFRQEGILASADDFPDPKTQELVVFATDTEATNKAKRVELNLLGDFSLFAREHNLSLSLADSQFDRNGLRRDMLDVAIIDLRDLSTRQQSVPEFGAPRAEIVHQDSQSARAALRLSLAEPVDLLLGANHKKFTYGASSAEQLKMNDTSLYAGLVWRLSAQASVYTSYTDIFELSFYLDKHGKMLDPTVGKNKEIGFRYAPENTDWAFDIAWFDIEQENYPISDPIVVGDRVHRAVDGVGSKGYEVELTGSLTSQWRAGLSYTNIILANSVADRIAKIVPDKVAKLHTDYTFANYGLTLGAYVNWTGERSGFYRPWGTPDFIYPQLPTYSVVGLVADYPVSEKLAVSLNVSNALDKDYVTKMSWFNSRPGEPRSYSLRLNYTF